MLVVFAGCAFFESGAGWSSQVSPSGPCYSFDLTDGVVAGENEELHAAFACVNRQGLLDPLLPVDAALDAPTRSGNVGGAAVGLLEVAADLEGISMTGVLRAVLGGFDDREGTERWLHLALELAYASSVEELGGAVPLNSAASLERGLLSPLYDTAGAVATAVLDDDRRALAPLSAALRSEATPRWLWTLALAKEAPDDDFAALAAEWPAVLAATIERTAEGSNDMDPGATGNSLRDGMVALAGSDALIDVVGAAAPILEDAHTVDLVAAWVIDEDHAGRWADLDDGLLYLASVDRTGSAISPGDDTALVSLIRLFHDANQPVTCTVDVLVTDLHVDLGNLAVAILQNLAKLDPDTAATGVGLLGDTLGYPLTEAILGTVADSGICPAFDEQLVADLESIDRLSDPSSQALLRALLGFLAATDEHVEAVANLAGALHDHDLVNPVEELLYDLGGTSTLRTLLLAVPAVADPDGRQAAGAFPPGVRPLDLHAVVEALLAAGNADTWHQLSPIVDTAITQPSTWVMVENSHHLLTQSGTTTADALDLLGEALAADPEGTYLSGAADLIDDPAASVPILELAENEALHAAVMNTELANVGPVPWLATLFVGGTVGLLWDTLALFRPFLGDSDV